MPWAEAIESKGDEKLNPKELPIGQLIHITECNRTPQCLHFGSYFADTHSQNDFIQQHFLAKL